MSVRSHWARLAASSGIDITYSQDGEQLTITAVPAYRSTMVENSDGAVSTRLDADFIVQVSNLNFASGIKYPKRRDKITYTDESGFERKYEVANTAAERHYDPMDAYGIMIRIHSVEISMDAVVPPEPTSWIWADGDAIVTAEGDHLLWQG
jgi:hypothetical protein